MNFRVMDQVIMRLPDGKFHGRIRFDSESRFEVGNFIFTSKCVKKSLDAPDSNGYLRGTALTESGTFYIFV